VLAGNFFCPYGNQGVYRSADGGNTWTYVLGDPANGTVCRQLRSFVGSSGVAFAALAGPFAGGDTAGGVLQSTDHGATWTPANGTGSNVLPSGTSMGRTLLAPAPSNPLVIYAVVTLHLIPSPDSTKPSMAAITGLSLPLRTLHHAVFLRYRDRRFAHEREYRVRRRDLHLRHKYFARRGDHRNRLYEWRCDLDPGWFGYRYRDSRSSYRRSCLGVLRRCDEALRRQ